MSAPASIAIIGAGRVGGTLARLWHAAGIPISAVFSRTREQAAPLAAQVGARLAGGALDACLSAELTVIAVPDDGIEGVAAQMAAAQPTLAGRAVVHTSGAKAASVLEPLRACGAAIGGLHPAYPFSSPDGEPTLASVTFGIEAEDAALRQRLIDLVGCIGGVPLIVPPGAKARYHAAFILVSNYMVTLYAAAERLLMEMGAERATADRALNTLLTGTLENLRARGVPDALTGPLARADVGTVAAHRRALADDLPLTEAYLSLAHLTRPLLVARGMSAADLARVDAVLGSTPDPMLNSEFQRRGFIDNEQP